MTAIPARDTGCHCLCPATHPDRPGICTATAQTTVTVRGVTVAACAACAAATRPPPGRIARAHRQTEQLKAATSTPGVHAAPDRQQTSADGAAWLTALLDEHALAGEADDIAAVEADLAATASRNLRRIRKRESIPFRDLLHAMHAAGYTNGLAHGLHAERARPEPDPETPPRDGDVHLAMVAAVTASLGYDKGLDHRTAAEFLALARRSGYVGALGMTLSWIGNACKLVSAMTHVQDPDDTLTPSQVWDLMQTMDRTMHLEHPDDEP